MSGSVRPPRRPVTRFHPRGGAAAFVPSPALSQTSALSVAITLAFTLVPAMAPGVAAQTPPGVSQGTKSLSFGIDGSGSSEAGLWIFISDRTNLGLLGTLDWVSEDRTGGRSDRSQFTLGVGPRVKWYITGTPRVGPYWFGGLNFLHTRRSEEGEPDRNSRGAGIDGGFGVDWFPVDQMSIGGWTGLRFTNDRLENDDQITRFRALTTGLRMHIYF